MILFDGVIRETESKEIAEDKFEDQETGPEECAKAKGITLPDQLTKKEIEETPQAKQALWDEFRRQSDKKTITANKTGKEGLYSRLLSLSLSQLRLNTWIIIIIVTLQGFEFMVMKFV